MAEQKTKIKAYIDGYFYMENEQHCNICGKMTNRINVKTNKRQCFNCDETSD